MVRYTALRLSLLAVVGVLLYLAGMRGILLAGTTIIVAALIAYVFFGKERDKVVEKMRDFRNRDEQPREPDEDMLVEDAYVDELLADEPNDEQHDPDRELD